MMDTEFSVRFSNEFQEENPTGVIHINVAQADEDVLSDFYFAMVYYDCAPSSELEPISQDEIWEGFQLKTKDYIINPGKTLTISGNISMAPEADIFIDRGGKVIIKGGRLTSSCDDLWNGIQVWGYREKSQNDELNPPGKIELTENAVIENSRTGISTIKSINGIEDDTYTGGIVWCKDSKFLNNIYGLRFYNYRNFDPEYPNYEIDNISYVKNCTFETNGSLADQNEYPLSFIRMDDIVGIKLYGNQYLNSTGNQFGWTERGKGIESFNSVYSIDEFCEIPPCIDSKRSYFHNLQYGIRAFGFGRENRALSIMV